MDKMTPDTLRTAIHQVAGSARAPYTPPHLMMESAEQAVRQKAFSVAKEIMANRDRSYGRPLVQAAQAYFKSLNRTAPETKRHELAKKLLDELEAHVQAAEQQIKVLRQYAGIVSTASGDHYNVAMTTR